jgi:integrase
MARTTGRLTALRVERLKGQPGMHADGGGLYLQVKSGGASWILRYMLARKPRYMGLGSLALCSLAEARARALEARQLVKAGSDPVEARRSARQRAALEAAKAITFRAAAESYVRSHRAGWRNAKHAGQWDATLATYAYPVLGDLPVAAVDTGLVLKVLESMWTAKAETASRLRGRLEAILDWAKVRGYRLGENPARWRGHLNKLLPARTKVKRVQHFEALPYAELPAFMARLRERDGIAARGLEFAILTVARTGEALDATWNEINLADRTWTVPASRIKAAKEHKVPLSSRAVAILQALPSREGLVFTRKGPPLGRAALLEVLEAMGCGATVHGFRSSFRDWCAERTNYPREVAEMALAHAVGDAVEAAYRRGDLFEKRRRLMQAWADHCQRGKVGTVLSIRQANPR